MKKHVCMIAYTLYPYDPRVRREAETLAALDGYKVSFLGLKENDLPKNFVMHNVNIIELNIKKYQGNNKIKYMFSYLNFTLRAFMACTKMFCTRQVDVFHFHNMPDFLVLAGIVPRIFGKKIVLDIHDSMPETYATKFGKGSSIPFKFFCAEEAISCKLAHKVISVNHVQRDILINRGIPAEKILVSMNMPDPKIFNLHDSPVTTGKTNPAGFKLVYHGTLAERLGIDLTFQAIAKLADRIPELEFYIFGKIDSDSGLKLKELSQKLGIGRHIRFNKFQQMESLVPVLREMQLGVIGNRRNTATELMLPVKMLEYIALDIPVIVPRLTAIQYYFSEDMVTYFEPEDVDSLAGAILELYSNPDKRLEKVRAARKFLEKYGWETHKMEFISFYNNL